MQEEVLEKFLILLNTGSARPIFSISELEKRGYQKEPGGMFFEIKIKKTVDEKNIPTMRDAFIAIQSHMKKEHCKGTTTRELRCEYVVSPLRKTTTATVSFTVKAQLKKKDSS